MSAGEHELDAEENGELERHQNGNIEVPQRYIDYSGQLVIRTRFATVQRWKSEGWDGGSLGTAPYILSSRYCRGSETLKPKNSALDADEISIYYVEDRETVRHRVIDDD